MKFVSVFVLQMNGNQQAPLGALKRAREHSNGAAPIRVRFAPDAEAQRMVAGLPQQVRNANLVV